VAEPVSLCFKRRSHLTEEQLADLLRWKIPEVDLDAEKGTAAKLLAQAKDSQAPSKVQTVLDLLPGRADLNGLPLRKGSDCQANATDARKLQDLAVVLRQALDRVKDRRTVPSHWEALLVYVQQGLLNNQARRDIRPEDWQRKEAVAPLVQILQDRDQALRLVLIRLLSQISDPVASQALAQRALFDLSEQAREEAVRALQGRPPKEYRQVLLAGLRYPWSPIADHAAEALVALRDRQAVPRLIGLLRQPDPQAPVRGENRKWGIPELVRINHLRNCVLCHAPSLAASDLVPGPVPTPGKPLPTETPYYGRSRSGEPFVRADVTYLRQDFSVQQPVPDHSAWPEYQRHDYVIRLREVAAPESSCPPGTQSSVLKAGVKSSYPQREAVLFALRELTGREGQASTEDWERWLVQHVLQAVP
jgi:hypothetical protein